MRISWIVLLCAFLISCSDFNLGYTPGGDPRPPIFVHDTLVDTLIVPADSLIVHARFSYRDTLIKKAIEVRSHNTLELRMKTEWTADVDTVGLFGITISDENISFGISRDSTRIVALDSVNFTSAGGLNRYEVYHSLYPESEYLVRFTNDGSKDAEISLEMLLGYSSKDSTVEQVTVINLREINEVIVRSGVAIPKNSYIWEKIAVQSGDSLWGVFKPDSGLNAYLFRSVEMDDLLQNGVLGDGLWNSITSAERWTQRIAADDTLFYVIENQSSESLELSDTLQLIRNIP